MKHNIVKAIVRTIGITSTISGFVIAALGLSVASGGLTINGKKY